MAVDIGPKIGIEGESEFRSKLNEVNQAIKTLGSEMGVVTSEFGKNENSVESLTRQNDVLERTLYTLQEKLNLQNEALQKSAEKYGEADTKTQKWQQAVNETQTALNKAKAEMDANAEAIDNIGNEADESGEALKDAGEKGLTFADVLKANLLSDAIKAGFKALTESIKAVGNALKECVTDSAAYADEILTLSSTTGLATDTLQEFQYMQDLVDVSLDTVTGSLTKLTRNMNTAKDGTGTAADAFASLGVAVTDESGQLRDNYDVFLDCIDALGKIENETERDATAMELFGKSAQDLNPLIEAGADTIQGFADEAHEMGYVLDEDALGSLGDMQDAFDRLSNLGTTLKNKIGSELAPALTDVLNGILDIGSGGTEGFNAISNGISSLISGFNQSLPQLASAGLGIVTGLAQAITTNAPALLTTGGEIIAQLALGFAEALPTIMESAPAIIEGLATGLTTALPALVESAISIISTLATSLTDPGTLGALVDGALSIITALAEGLITNLPTLIAQAPEIVSNLVTAIIENAPKLLESALELIVSLATGIYDNLNQIIESGEEIVANIVEAITNKINDIIDVGKNIVEGIKQGISDAWASLTTWVTEKFQGLVNSVKGLLGINSPSKLFAKIGGFTAEGFGVGFEDEFANVKRMVNSSMQGLAADSTISATYSTRGMATAVDNGTAMKNALNGVGIYMDGAKVGNVITTAQNNQYRARGVSPLLA